MMLVCFMKTVVYSQYMLNIGVKVWFFGNNLLFLHLEKLKCNKEVFR